MEIYYTSVFALCTAGGRPGNATGVRVGYYVNFNAIPARFHSIPCNRLTSAILRAAPPEHL